MQLKILLFFFLFYYSITGFSQPDAVYSFPLEDTVLRNQLYKAALEKKEAMIAGLSGEFKKEFKEVYESRFDLIASLMKSSRLVAEPDAHQYLQQMLTRIVSVNDELKALPVRLLFSRDSWPNAYSIGEGTLVVNAGLLLRIKNEAELVFVLCHELAHYYLDHSEKRILKSIRTINSESVRSELKKLSTQEYGTDAAYDKLLMSLAYDARRHSREHESEADKYAIRFMSKTGYSTQGAISCLQMLDRVDDTTLYAKLQLKPFFHFQEYAFKNRWVQEETSIFSQMKGDTGGLTEAERDSLSTHPDCPQRMAALDPVIRTHPAGRFFLVDSALFQRLKDRFSAEIIEELYQEKRYALSLYFSIGLLQSGQQKTFAVYSVARLLNEIYEAQLQHRLGLVVEKENRRYMPDYNQLLRLLDRVRLDELADLNYYFCLQYSREMAGYPAFEEEWRKAKQHKEKYTH